MAAGAAFADPLVLTRDNEQASTGSSATTAAPMTKPARYPGRLWMARVDVVSDLPATLDALAVARGRPVLVVVGGAGRMNQEHLNRTAAVLTAQIIPVLDRLGVTVIDGGTDSGVMRVIGQARSAAGAAFPLIGVAAEGTVCADSASAHAGTAQIEPHHSHVILVPGDSWGDESPWLADVADAVAGTSPSATLVINGGEITYDDIAHSLQRRRPVVVLAGTGRTADTIAAARDGDTRGPAGEADRGLAADPDR